MPSVQEVCVHNLTHKQPSLTQPLWDALPQLSGGERRLLTHMDTSSLAASQICFKRGGSVDEIFG